MRARDTSTDQVKKLIYFLDETTVFVVSVVSIIFSDVLQKSIQGGVLVAQDFSHLSWTKIIVASFISIILYGNTNESFKYNDRHKPPFMKRVYNAILHGLAWKTIIGIAGVG